MPAYKRLETLAAPYQDLSRSPIPSDFYDSDRAMGYENLYDMQPVPYTPSCLVAYGDWRRRIDAWQAAQGHQPLVMSGLIRLNGYGFFGPDALPIHVKRYEALIGQPLGWPGDIADAYAALHSIDDVFTKPLHGNDIGHAFGVLLPLDRAVVLTFPEHEKYGRWVLDMLPRLAMLRTIPPKTPILLDPLPDWAGWFLDALGIDHKRVRPMPARYFTVKEAVIPTLTRTGAFLSPLPMIEAWDQVVAFYNRDPVEPSADKVFLSRGGGHDAAMEANGYTVVRPETLSVREQIGLIRNAGVIAAEDGSALYTLAFAEGKRVGVLTRPGPDNLLPIGIASLRSHRLVYAQPDDDLGRFLAVVENRH